MLTFVCVLLLVFGLIVGNLLWLRPSAAEKALTVQRAQAKALGIHVVLRPAPDWLALPAGERLVAHYTCAVVAAADRLGRWRWHEGLGNWQPIGHPEAWLQPIPWPTPAPAGWLGIDVRADSVTLYWREDGLAASVQHIFDTLQQLAA